MSSPPATRARRRLPREERLAQLLDVAEGLFVERGYAAVSMEDICRAAGVSRPIVYGHFESKEGAYLACVQRARERFEQRMVAGVDVALPPREQLRRGLDAFFAMVEEDPGRWRLLFSSNSVLPGAYATELTDLRFASIELVAALLRPMARGEVPDVRIERAAHAVSGMAERLGHWWLRNPSASRDDLVDDCLDVLWDGIGRYVADPPAGG